MSRIKKALLLKQLDQESTNQTVLDNIERKDSLTDMATRQQAKGRMKEKDPNSFADYIKFLYETHQGTGAWCKYSN